MSRWQADFSGDGVRIVILYNGPTSPFGRFARVVALELGIAHEEKTIDVYAAGFLDQFNPLRQIPTLILDDGRPIYDSRVIVAYFDSVSGRPTLFPADEGWDLHVRLALAIGLMEAGLQRRMEVIRPVGERSAATIAKLEQRIGRAIDRMEALVSAIAATGLRGDQIATAVALEYTEFRYGKHWHHAAPNLAVWLADFARRPSMAATRPRA